MAALKAGIGIGLTAIDTAEMYANGERGKVFVVSKVQSSNVSCRGTIAACEASLRRLKTDVIDLYLPHFPGAQAQASAGDDAKMRNGHRQNASLALAGPRY